MFKNKRRKLLTLNPLVNIGDKIDYS